MAKPAASTAPGEEHAMSSSAATPDLGGPALEAPSAREAASALTRLWWLWLVAGIAWIMVALVVLQFDQASITTIGVLVGVMFFAAGAQQLMLATMAESLRWLWALFGVLFLIAGVICLVNPEKTFAGLADILGFLFAMVGAWWIIQAFVEKEANPIWWLGLISGVLMVILAFWTSGQFFIEKAYTLLVFAGIWALMHGVGDIVRAFQLRSLRDRI
jgi:uncharacterized membrane protein HdeD (DUF308 family)